MLRHKTQPFLLPGTLGFVTLAPTIRISLGASHDHSRASRS